MTNFKYQQFSKLALVSFGLIMVLMLSSCGANKPHTTLPNTDLTESAVDITELFQKPQGVLALDEFHIVCIKEVKFANISAHTSSLIEIDAADSILIREQNTVLSNVKGFSNKKKNKKAGSSKTVCNKFFNDYDELGFEATKEIDYKKYHREFLKQSS